MQHKTIWGVYVSISSESNRSFASILYIFLLTVQTPTQLYPTHFHCAEEEIFQHFQQFFCMDTSQVWKLCYTRPPLSWGRLKINPVHPSTPTGTKVHHMLHRLRAKVVKFIYDRFMQLQLKARQHSIMITISTWLSNSILWRNEVLWSSSFTACID